MSYYDLGINSTGFWRGQTLTGHISLNNNNKQGNMLKWKEKNMEEWLGHFNENNVSIRSDSLDAVAGLEVGTLLG